MPLNQIPQEMKPGTAMSLAFTVTVETVYGFYNDQHGRHYDVLLKMPGKHAGRIRRIITIK